MVDVCTTDYLENSLWNLLKNSHPIEVGIDLRVDNFYALKLNDSLSVYAQYMQSYI